MTETPETREMIYRALIAYGNELRKLARSRQYGGPQNVQYRANLRVSAHLYERLAARYEDPERNES